MAAVLVQVADAVTALLNTASDGTFSQRFVAVRNYPTWKLPLTKLCDVRVDVVPESHPVSELDGREPIDYICRVIVVVRRKFKQSDRQEETDEGRNISNESIDALVLLIEQIHEYFCSQAERRLQNDDGIDSTWNATKILQTYNHDHLQNNAQFTGAVQVDYRVSKPSP